MFKKLTRNRKVQEELRKSTFVYDSEEEFAEVCKAMGGEKIVLKPDDSYINPFSCDNIQDALSETKVNQKIIPYGTKIIYHGDGGWENCKCYCGHYNEEDDTYNIYRGWDLCHVPKDEIEIYEWEDNKPF